MPRRSRETLGSHQQGRGQVLPGRGAWRPQGPSEDDARGGEQWRGRTTQRCSGAASRDGWRGTPAPGVPLRPPSTTGKLGGDGWSPSRAGGLEQCLHPREERGHSHATVPSLGERLSTAGVLYHVPLLSPLTRLSTSCPLSPVNVPSSWFLIFLQRPDTRLRVKGIAASVVTGLIFFVVGLNEDIF